MLRFQPVMNSLMTIGLNLLLTSISAFISSKTFINFFHKHYQLLVNNQ